MPSGETEAEQLVEAFRVNAVGAAVVTASFAPLLKKSSTTPRIVYVTSGGGSITNRLDPNGLWDELKVVPYRVSKAALHMVFACNVREYEEDGFKLFLYGPGPTASNLTEHNKVELGVKPTSEGAGPIVAMVNGMMDSDARKYVEYGQDSFPW